MIIAAAIKHEPTGIVTTGVRHAQCFERFWNEHPEFKESYGDMVVAKNNIKQGFVTNKNEFMERKEAAEYAYRNGQISKPQKTLFSEDLW